MGANRTSSYPERKLSIPPGFVSLTSFTLNKEPSDSVAVGTQLPTIISTTKLKTSVRHRPWIIDDHVGHMEEDSECQADKSSSSSANLPKGVIRGCPNCHNCQKVIARFRPELARMPSLEEAPVLYPTEEEFEDTLKYVASILPHVLHHGVCRIVPPSSWKPPCLVEEDTVGYGVDTHIQRISDLQSQFSKKRFKEAHKKRNNKRQKILSRSSDYGHGVQLKEFGCCIEHLEFESGPKFTLKSFKNYADHFKKQYFVKEDRRTESNFNSDVMQVLSEPSVSDIEGEYWRIIENPTEEIEVLHGNSTQTRARRSRLPRKNHSQDLTECPQYVESGWNLNATPMLQDSLLRFETHRSPSILLPRLSMGMCFSSNLWRVEEHHLYLLSYIHFGAPKLYYGVPGSYRCKFEEAVIKHMPQLSGHPLFLHNLATQFSPSTLTSEGIPVYRCVQNPKEFVLILPGAYHAEFDSGFNCSEAVNFAPFDWLPHGQSAVQLYCEQGRKTSISHDKLLLESAIEAIRAFGEDNLKWRAICQSNGILAKALKSRVTSEVRRRKYLCASLESQKMEDDFCATTKRECLVCFYDLYLSAIGCNCSPDKYTCLLHAKQLCACAWSEKYMLIRNEIDELNIMVEALNGKVSAIHKCAKEKLGLPVPDVPKDAGKDGGMLPSLEMMEQREPVISQVELSNSPSHCSTSRASGMEGKAESRQTLDIQEDIKEELFTPSLCPSASTSNLDWISGSGAKAEAFNHRSHSKGNAHEENEDLLPKYSQQNPGKENIVTSSCTGLKKHLARESTSTERNVIILSSDDEN